MSREIDVLIPTYDRPAPLAVTLATLLGQTFRDFRVVISDQTGGEGEGAQARVVQAVVEVLRFQGVPVEIHENLPRKGVAHQRQFLLDRVEAPYALFLDDDVILEPDALATMHGTIAEEGCGFVGCFVASPAYLDDERPEDQAVEFWDGPVEPERVRPGTPEWDRARLHSAANVLHVAENLDLSKEDTRTYRVAWLGGCWLADAEKLRDVGGYEFWQDLPEEHVGEDAVAQVRLMETHGGCGLLPTRAYHQVVGTTIPNRDVDAPEELLDQPRT